MNCLMEKNQFNFTKLLINHTLFTILAICLMACANTNMVYGQLLECATISNPQDDASYLRLIQEVERGNLSREDINISMRIVIFTNSIGGSDVSTSEVTNSIAALKKIYSNFGIIINNCNPVFIKNPSLNNLDRDKDLPLLESFLADNTINVFISDAVYANGELVCGFATLPFNVGKKYIVLNAPCVVNNSTFSHELGHFFGLYHTHHTTFGKEYVSRINCQSSGDLLCDTPADPILSSANVSSNCTYFGTKKDELGSYYMPDVQNLMSYAPKSCRYEFSSSQIAIMRKSAVEYFSNYSKECSANDISLYSDFKFEESPLSGQNLVIPFSIILNKYTEEFNYKVSTFIIDPQGKSTLLNSEDYQTSDNSFDDSLAFELPSKMKTGLYKLKLEIELSEGISEINMLDNYVNFPLDIDYSNLDERNVFYNSANKNIHLYIKNMLIANLTIQVFDVVGKTVFATKDFHSTLGEYVNTIDASSISRGLYIVSIHDGKEHYTGKVFID